MVREKVRKPAEYRPLCSVDTAELRSRLLAVGEAAWNAEDARKENKFACFKQTRHIIARFIPGNRDPEEFYSTPFWTVWRPLLEPILRQVAAEYGFTNPEFPKVMFARLEAGGVVDRHVDGAGSNLVTHKIHVPIVTHDRVWFEVDGKTFRLEEGQAYELNNLKPHAVRNEGSTDRIHLIFEVMEAAA
jgi:hypothetical protein